MAPERIPNLPVLLILIGLLMTTSCSSDTQDAGADLVCGAIPRDLVVQHLTDETDFRTTGDLSIEADRAEGTTCQILAGSRTFLTVTVVDLRDQAESSALRTQLEGERTSLKASGECASVSPVDSSLGYGTVCTTPAGEADLSVLTEHRLIRLLARSVGKDVDAGGAIAIARAIEDNVGA